MENHLNESHACHFGKMAGISKSENHKLLQFEKKSQDHDTEDGHVLYPMQTKPQQQHTLSNELSVFVGQAVVSQQLRSTAHLIPCDLPLERLLDGQH